MIPLSSTANPIASNPIPLLFGKSFFEELLIFFGHFVPPFSQSVLDEFLLMNVRGGSEPIHNPAIGIAIGQGPAEEPSVGSVRGTLEAILDVVGFTASQRLGPLLVHLLQVFRMKESIPSLAASLLGRESRVFKPTTVVIFVVAVRACNPDDLRKGVGQSPQDFKFPWEPLAGMGMEYC